MPFDRRVIGSNPTLAATQGPWASPSLTVASSDSACRQCQLLWSEALLKGLCCEKRYRNGDSKRSLVPFLFPIFSPYFMEFLSNLDPLLLLIYFSGVPHCSKAIILYSLLMTLPLFCVQLGRGYLFQNMKLELYYVSNRFCA